MKKLGILTNSIGNSQKSISMYHNINTLCDNCFDLDCIVFETDSEYCKQHNKFPIMHSVEALDYDGVLISTDIMSTYLLNKCLTAKKKYFYIWDIDWHLQNKPLQFIKSTYMNPEINLIARSKDHAKIISKIFKEPKYIVEDFNYEKIKTIIYS